MSQEIAKIEPKEIAAPAFGANMVRNFDDLNKLGTMAVKSGMFKDIKDQAAACMKILAGLEMGIGPMASLRGLHVFNGKVEASAGLIAAKIKAHDKYNYRVVVSDAKKCEIEWFEDGKSAGFSSFTIEEAQKARLADKDVWKNFATDMLFARALTRGQRKYAPDVFEGAIYAPGEVSDAVEGEIVSEQSAPTSVSDDTEPLIAEIHAIWDEMGGPTTTWDAYYNKYLADKPLEVIEKRLAEVRAKADKKRAEAAADTSPDDLLASIERECANLITVGAGQDDINEAIAAVTNGVYDLNQIAPESFPAVLDALLKLRAAAEAHIAKTKA